MSFLDTLKDLLVAATGCCIPNPNISINGRAYRIVKLLGEGGFSFVYLAQDGSGNLYALKKIRCTLGTQEAKQAHREVEIYRLFEHKNIIRMLDTSTVKEHDGSETIYIFLPYYKEGNLQDAISRNSLNGSRFSQSQMMKLFHEICIAVEVLHSYKPPISVTRTSYTANSQHSMGNDDHENKQDRALLDDQAQQDSSTVETHRPGKEGEIIPWAHRDIKPGNVLLSDDRESPVLMDFGSACEARIEIKTRQQALAAQDHAAEHCSMPYRAPELFDVKTETTLDERVDIWSLGCTLYAMAYGQSPFEKNINDQGGSMALAVLNGNFTFPTVNDDYSQDFKDLISWMLTAEPSKRPDIHEVLAKVKIMLQSDTSH